MLLILWSLFICSLAQSEESAVSPFSINVPDEVLSDLKGRLANARFIEPLENSTSWARGTSTDYMKELVSYWQQEYDWRKQEQYLNKVMPQFVTTIEGHTVHFVHRRSSRADAEPLIIVHGWPGSFVEFHKVIDLLVGEGGDGPAFHVVCPSLPGYGFSKVAKGTVGGLNQKETSRIFFELMQRLGYKKFWAQGGDWGSFVTTMMAVQHPEAVKGLHLNMVSSSAPLNTLKGKLWVIGAYLFPSLFLYEGEYERFKTFFSTVLDLTGYFHLQATKPQTLGYALHDSPVGLAAYIIEKFRTWSDCSPRDTSTLSYDDLSNTYTKDELLNNIMLYWINGPTLTINYYYEFIQAGLLNSEFHVSVPTAVAEFPKELLHSRSLAEWKFNIFRWTKMPRGGHFAAFEEPELLVKDIKEFRLQLEKEWSNKKGKEDI